MSPEPHEHLVDVHDVLAEPPMAALAIAAEQVLLGDMLHKAAAGDDNPMATLELLIPEDFYRPYHQQIFLAARRITRSGESPTPQRIRAELIRDRELPQHVAHDGIPLLKLMAAASRTRSQAAAGLVLEAAVRRWITATAVRLAQLAAEEPFRPDAAADHISIALRWASWWTDRLDRLGLPAEARNRDESPAAAASVVPTEPVPAQAEIKLLTALTAYPDLANEVLSWLPEESFTCDWTRYAYRAIKTSALQGQPLDPLLLCRILPPIELEKLLDHVADGMPWVNDMARQVHRRSSQLLSHEAARRLELIVYQTMPPIRRILENAQNVLHGLHVHLDAPSKKEQPDDAAGRHLADAA